MITPVPFFLRILLIVFPPVQNDDEELDFDY